MVWGLKHIAYEKRCRELRLLNLEKKPRRNVITVFHYLKGQKTQPNSFKKCRIRAREAVASPSLGFQNSTGQGLKQPDLTLRVILL